MNEGRFGQPVADGAVFSVSGGFSIPVIPPEITKKERDTTISIRMEILF